VKEKAFKIFNHYEIFDSDNRKLGYVQETKDFLKKLTRRFEVNIFDGEKKIIVLKKPFSIIRPRIHIHDVNGVLLGTFVKKLISFRPRFFLNDANERHLGKLEGDFIGWNYSLNDESGNMVAEISKKFSGVLREVFTTADSYKIHFNHHKSIDDRLALAVPFMVDLLSEQRKRNSDFHMHGNI